MKEKIDETELTFEKLEDKVFSHSLESLASVLNKEERETDLYNEEDCAILKVLKIVAGHTGGMAVRLTAVQNYCPDKNGLIQLAKDSGIRVREVLLRDAWYKKDNGHLIGFYNTDTETRIPVAIIRNPSNRYYTVYNPENEESFILTKQKAMQLEPKAFMVYKKLPEGKISWNKLTGFLFNDIRKDLNRYILIGILCTLIGLITPFITKSFTDGIIPLAAKNQAVQICILVFICNISAMTGSIAKYLANLRMETKSDTDLEASVMDRLLKLPVNFFKGFSSGDLAARISAIPVMRKKAFNIVFASILNFIFSLVYLIQAVYFCPALAKAGVLPGIIPIAVAGITSLATYNLKKSLTELQGKNQGMLYQFFTGIEKIANTSSEKRAFSQWANNYAKQIKKSYSLYQSGIASSIINLIYPTVVTILFYLIFGEKVLSENIEEVTTGSFLAFLTAYSLFQCALLRFSEVFFEIRDLIPLSKRIRPIVETEPEIDEVKPSVEIEEGKIEISHLNFRYSPQSPLVLNDLSMKVEPGQFVAITGNSGAGKSTLLRALLGFEHPESGSIFYDNHDINTMDLGALRRQMGVVLQNDSVLQGTILQNILGTSGLSEEAAWEAARKVSLDKDIEELPMGMYTMIPAGGKTLSGGQLQRLIIARAILKNPKILLFDEATSALDNITQQTVSRSLEALKATRIVIAHRLSTIINADKIYVMKDGKVVEEGSYEQLMKMNGWFAELAKRQL